MQWRSNHGSRNNQSNISSGNRKADFGKISDTRNGTGLYGQSALYIFGLFVEEREYLNNA